MHPRVTRTALVCLCTSLAVLASPVTPAARAYPGTTAPATVATVTDGFAQRLAVSLAVRAAVVSRLAAGSTDAAGLPLGSALTREAQDANRRLLLAKGLPATSGSILRLRLADPATYGALLRGVPALVAAVPDDDVATTVTAYRPGGGPVLLDAYRAPQAPVLVVDVDTSKALSVGLGVLRNTLAARGITGISTGGVGVHAGYWATKVNAIRLSDDKEPWVKGGAEIFNIVGGFGLDGKAKVDTVQMPYLDNDGTTYFPNQLLVHFSAYKYNLADVVMMEDDGDTNYQSLAQAIANALLSIVDGGAYTPLVNAILAAIPGSWWSDDPDYVDSWYTLSTGSGGRLNGASGNGWMDVAPYWVAEL